MKETEHHNNIEQINRFIEELDILIEEIERE